MKHLIHWHVPWFGIYYRCACGHFEKRPYGWTAHR